MPPALQKPMRKFEQGVYTVTDVRWGMALDLSSADNRSPIAFGSHGWENQQWEFRPCGAGIIIKNVSSGTFLTLEDLQGLHLEASVEVVTGDFPTCWEMEVMDNGSAEDGEDEDGDVYARYVNIVMCAVQVFNFIVMLASGCRVQRWPWASREAMRERRYVFARIPHVS
ncbi:hypothetical protein BJV74DRAFT_790305 [Russula compacta]|nr:hypothetical protein BJV74DRAFT_790305 [Russula compacta]